VIHVLARRASNTVMPPQKPFQKRVGPKGCASMRRVLRSALPQKPRVGSGRSVCVLLLSACMHLSPATARAAIMTDPI
jgi:hypothetical protein